jgi:DNA mismatch repair ATPase MutS
MLRTELAFYLACANLHHQLGRKGVPVCFPVPAPPGARKHSCVGLRDACLALSMDQTVVGNDLDADGKNLFIITGANKGGKSTFLRGVGLAQLMMQCGMFVTAESFSADICRSLFTHYKREEDAGMKSGKFDEELGRMSNIVDALTPDSMLLFNESFAATNEREGSEIARQIVCALLETRIKIIFVTHLYEFAHRLGKENADTTLFLRAERQADGRRTFKLLLGEPLQTSFGADLYEETMPLRKIPPPSLG